MSINTPNAVCYYKPVITVNEGHPADRPHIVKGYTVPCRVMAKTIKFFHEGTYRTTVKQIKREDVNRS